EAPSLLRPPSSAEPKALTPDVDSADVGVFPGGRSPNVHAFASRLAVDTPQLPESSWKELFLQTSGHLLAGEAVLQGAESMGHDLSTVDASRYTDLVSPDVLTQIRHQTPDRPELRLAHLLAFMRDINAATLAMAAKAMPSLGSLTDPSEFADSDPLDIADLTAHLVDDGVLLPALDRAGHHTIPPVLAGILRRLHDPKDRHSESRSRRALGAAAAEWLQTPSAYHSDGFDEALRQAADAGCWSALTQLWADWGHALMVDHFDSAIEAFSKIPETQGKKSAVLAEAMGDSLQVSEIRQRLRTDDALTVLSQVDFKHTTVPTLTSQMDQISNGDCTVDDILTMAIAAMRRHRLLGQSDQGLEAASLALEHLNDSRRFQSTPSRLCEARFHLERGITTMLVGDIPASIQLLRRSIIIMELATASSPYLLQPAHAYSALAHAMLGNGPSSDVHLQHVDELMDRTRFSSPHALTADTLARMIRATDTLELDEASEFAARLTDPSMGDHSWIGVALYRALLGIVRGDVGIEDKRLQQAIDTHRSSLPADGILIDNLQLTLVSLHLAHGQTHLAQNVLLHADPASPYIILARAHLHLTIGEYGTAAHLANRVLSHKSLDLHAKASARAIEAASLFGRGDLVDSDSAFVGALEYCRITAGLTPVALIPKALRDQLIQRSSANTAWDLIAPVFGDATGSADESIGGPSRLSSGERLRQRLLDLGETLRPRTGHSLLSPSQRQLLALLDAQSSVSAIAAELSLVEGTVKNKLSNLYSRLGVRNRRDALARGYEFGYLPSDH
ncbi:helix-turn-helix transcriptional regulator, partial [Brevibacterium sp.]|uniref:helix-turn-helix transcriptional regulator n=1 Tax=Brevibacterium sp. TaxID=1701 RepID=UPI0026491868